MWYNSNTKLSYKSLARSQVCTYFRRCNNLINHNYVIFIRSCLNAKKLIIDKNKIQLACELVAIIGNIYYTD